ncbi:MAG TPA: N-acetyl-gamma-glutamyl-phosphate reductase [Caldilineae bacterium]|nr:N-acetyl-gamma-glutamyl-phosphate reductase [Caldilineae bacterium]HIQ11526.1 N-acetyl-gamma-glutamyl-phosphate reductase [Caldilineales bacterium]
MIHIGIVGATGYTGFELLRLIARHPHVRLAWATSESAAGKRISELYPTPDETRLIHFADAPLREADVIFFCLPHAASMDAVARARDAGVRAIDLSADFRLPDPDIYERWYHTPHTQTNLLSEAVYGLCEVNREAIADAVLVANPGCYPTAVNLGLWPLARAGALGPRIIADSKSGVSGAGRKLRLSSHFVEINENMVPYSIGYAHRHIAEMELILGAYTPDIQITFTPQLIPVNRGILSTLYVDVDPGLGEEDVRAIYQDAYGDEPFIHLLPPGQHATLRHAVGTNRAAIGLTPLPRPGQWIVTVSEDNLLKGASGQAVQNMNIMFGLEETAGFDF